MLGHLSSCAALQAADQMNGQRSCGSGTKRGQNANGKDCQDFSFDLFKDLQHAKAGGQEEKSHILQQKIRSPFYLVWLDPSENQQHQKQGQPEYIAGQRSVHQDGKRVACNAAREQYGQLFQVIQVSSSSFSFP